MNYSRKFVQAAILFISPYLIGLGIAKAELVNQWGVTQLYEAVYHQDPGRVDRLLKNGADPNFQALDPNPVFQGRPVLSNAVMNGGERGRAPVAITILLLEAGADPTIKAASGNSPLSYTAGYRFPGTKYTRDHSSGWLHQLMLSYVDDPSKLDETMKWQGKGCYGYVVERTDRKLSLIAQKVYGDPDRWPELAELNGISKDNPYRLGNCLKVFDIYW